jgi:imidazoleglycerol-phosphate dehydratase
MPDDAPAPSDAAPAFAPRTATVTRTTKETDVRVALGLDPQPGADATGEGDGTQPTRATGVGFLDHMLDLLAKHGALALDVRCDGDLHIDDHHTVEDVGIALGQALGEAVGDKAHIARYGHAYVPMDESLARAVIDLSGRFALHFDATFPRATVGDLSTEMVEHFFYSVAEHARCNLHLSVLYGRNTHHMVEALFKAFARALRMAVTRDAAHARMPSTKGAL